MTRVYPREVWYSCFVAEQLCDYANYGPPDCKNCPEYQAWVKEGKPKLCRVK